MIRVVGWCMVEVLKFCAMLLWYLLLVFNYVIVLLLLILILIIIIWFNCFGWMGIVVLAVLYYAIDFVFGLWGYC